MSLEIHSFLPSTPTTSSEEILLTQATPAMLDVGDGRSVSFDYIPLREIERQGGVPLSSQLFIAGATVWAWTGGPVPLDLNIGEAMFLGFSAVGAGVLVLEQMRTSEADRTRYYLQRQDGSRVELDPKTTYVAPVSNIPTSQPVASPAQSIPSAQTSSSYTPVYGPPTIPFSDASAQGTQQDLTYNPDEREIVTNGTQTIRDAAARPIPTTLSSANPAQISAEGQAVLARMQEAEQWLNEQILAATSGDSPQSKPEPKGEEESPPPVVEKPSEDGLPGLDTTPAGPLVPAGEQGQTGAQKPTVAPGEEADSSPVRSGPASGGRISGGEFPSPTPGGEGISSELAVALAALLLEGIRQGVPWILNQLQQQGISVPDPVVKQLQFLEQRWRDFNQPDHWQFVVDPETGQMHVVFDRTKMADIAKQELEMLERKFGPEVAVELYNAAINGGLLFVHNVVVNNHLSEQFTYRDIARVQFLLGVPQDISLYHDAVEHAPGSYGTNQLQEYIGGNTSELLTLFLSEKLNEEIILTFNEVISSRAFLVDMNKRIDEYWTDLSKPDTFARQIMLYLPKFDLSQFIKEFIASVNLKSDSTAKQQYLDFLKNDGYLAHLNTAQIQRIDTILNGTDGRDLDALMFELYELYQSYDIDQREKRIADILYKRLNLSSNMLHQNSIDRHAVITAISDPSSLSEREISVITDLSVMVLRLASIILKGSEGMMPTQEELTKRLLLQIILYCDIIEQSGVTTDTIVSFNLIFNQVVDHPYPADLSQRYEELLEAFNEANSTSYESGL